MAHIDNASSSCTFSDRTWTRPWPSRLPRGGMPAILSGTALILAGLLDHWQLVRVLGAPEARSREVEGPAPVEVRR